MKAARWRVFALAIPVLFLLQGVPFCGSDEDLFFFNALTDLLSPEPGDPPPPKLSDSGDAKVQAAGQAPEAGANVDEAESVRNDAIENQDPDKLDDGRTSRPADPLYPATKAALHLALGAGPRSPEVKAALGELKGAVAAGLPGGVDDSNFKRDFKGPTSRRCSTFGRTQRPRRR